MITRAILASYVTHLGIDREIDRVATDLQELGWLSTLHLKGAWAFVPAGEAPTSDPYIDLHGWRARDPDAVFALAGEAAAWHLGYLPRRFDGTVAIWLPRGERVPHGLRPHVSVVRLDWETEKAHRLGPTSKLLRRKGLDLTGWAGGLPSFGPDALIAQLGTRPGSFRAWADLISQLDVLAADCDLPRLAGLLDGRSASAWQRVAYLLDRGGRRDVANGLLELRPYARLSAAQFGDGPVAVWSNDYGVNDRLIVPLQARLGKA